MELLFQVLVSGILLGGLYALMALGLALVWGVLNIVNLSHGALIMLGAYVTYFLVTGAHIDPFAALPIAAAVLFATVFSIGSFTRYAELTAAKASGISFYRMILPILLGAVFACGLDLALGEVVPLANRRRTQLLGRQTHHVRYPVHHHAHHAPQILCPQMGPVVKTTVRNTKPTSALASPMEPTSPRLILSSSACGFELRFEFAACLAIANCDSPRSVEPRPPLLSSHCTNHCMIFVLFTRWPPA